MFFHDPWILILLPFTLIFILYADRRAKPSIRFPSGHLLTNLRHTLKVTLSKNIAILRLMAVSFMIFALSRPQSPIEESKIQTEGIDIVLAIDCSTSMLAEDFKMPGGRRNRLEVVKEVVRDFIKGRANDRIGIVAFAARAYTVCPLTLDYGWILHNLDRIKIGIIEDGTAIGSGIASSLNRLKDTKSKGKIIVLLTDGRNNAGNISPLTAAEAAKALGVKIYTIGVGTKGLAPYPMKDFFGNTVYRPIEIEIDEDTLMKIASKTEGVYFRATDAESLRGIYKQIDKLEKSPIEETEYLEYKELFPVFLIPGFILLFLEIILSNTILRNIP